MERHEVVCIGQTSDVIVWGGRQEVDTPSGKKLKIIALSDQVSAPELINNYYAPEFKLDLIIGFMDAFGIQYLNDVKTPVFGWIPIDGPFTPMWKHYLKNYHKIFAYSRFGYNELLKWFPPAKVGYIPHGISEAFKHMDRDKAREEFELFTPQADSPGQVQREDRIPKDSFLAVNVGANMGPRKNLPLLMRTFKKFVDRGHKDAHLYMHTNAFMIFPRGYDLIQWRLMLKAEKNIHFPMYNPIVSPASNEELAKIHSAADVYVQNSDAEGFGLPLVEAMACGTPIISPMNSAQTELIEGHGWGVENVPDDMYAQIPVYVPMLPTYPVPNQLSLLEKLEEAYNSPEKRRQYGAAALSYVEENHSWKVCMSAWFRALEEVESEIKVLDGLAEAFRAPSPQRLE
jgi:glycosyltransferase involved in cell wall biosynthesis